MAYDTEFYNEMGKHLRFSHFVIVTIASILLITFMNTDIKDVQKDLDTINKILHHFKPKSDRSPSLEMGVLYQTSRQLLFPETFKKIKKTGRLEIKSGSGVQFNPIRLGAPDAIIFHGKSAYSDVGYYTMPRLYSIAENKYPYYNDLSQASELGLGAIIEGGIWRKYYGLPSKIKEFKKFWNDCNQMRTAYRLASFAEPKAYLVVGDKKSANVIPVKDLRAKFILPSTFIPAECKYYIPLETGWKYMENDSPGPTNFTQVGRILSDRQIGYSNILRGTLGIFRQHPKGSRQNVFQIKSMKPGDIIVASHAEYVYEELKLQERLLNSIGEAKRVKGSFEKSFPNINRFLNEINYEGDTGIDALQMVVSIEIKRGGNSLEIAGLKIPRQLFNFGGIAFLTVVQLYFLLHLKELLSRKKKGKSFSNFPWIAFYRGKVPFSVFVFSILFLPLFVSVTAAVKHSDSGIMVFIPNLISCIVSVLIMIFTIKPVIGLREQILDVEKTSENGV